MQRAKADAEAKATADAVGHDVNGIGAMVVLVKPLHD